MPGLGVRVKQCRERQNIPVNELGRRIGRSGSLISRIEREETAPSVAVLAGIAASLDCSIDYLVTGVEAIPRKAVITRKSVGDNWTEIEVKLGPDGLIVVAK